MGHSVGRRIVLVWSLWYALCGLGIGWLVGLRYPSLAYQDVWRYCQLFQHSAGGDNFERAMNNEDAKALAATMFIERSKRIFYTSILPAAIVLPSALVTAQVASWRAGLLLSHTPTNNTTTHVEAIAVVMVCTLAVYATLRVCLSVFWPAKEGYASRKEGYLGGIRDLLTAALFILVVEGLFAVYEATALAWS
jgi:ABC-type long-subunit fatty acid transport system fused permease/ATPase subunit